VRTGRPSAWRRRSACSTIALIRLHRRLALLASPFEL
jgi:hypothetical protein